ncbi:hypothetical protein WN51_05782 [Melipona quadrifasciata]|uniref:Uncharacterized protein n=1 Tax=Melipona quadrifasciata TaxID=166423 RepID=A0A0M9A790_9HYME|nr:hypothetical protein WN51_05782 [Melipona quadrifasciata]
MLRSSNVEEKGHLVDRLMAAHVASERVLVTVVSHMNGIHHHIAKYDVAVLTRECQRRLVLHESAQAVYRSGTVTHNVRAIRRVTLLQIMVYGGRAGDFRRTELRRSHWDLCTIVVCRMIGLTGVFLRLGLRFRFGATTRPVNVDNRQRVWRTVRVQHHRWVVRVLSQVQFQRVTVLRSVGTVGASVLIDVGMRLQVTVEHRFIHTRVRTLVTFERFRAEVIAQVILEVVLVLGDERALRAVQIENRYGNYLYGAKNYRLTVFKHKPLQTTFDNKEVGTLTKSITQSVDIDKDSVSVQRSNFFSVEMALAAYTILDKRSLSADVTTTIRFDSEDD